MRWSLVFASVSIGVVVLARVDLIGVMRVLLLGVDSVMVYEEKVK